MCILSVGEVRVGRGEMKMETEKEKEEKDREDKEMGIAGGG